MGQGRRPPRRVKNTGQGGFEFYGEVPPSEAQRQRLSDERFKDDDATHLFIGDRRLDAVLREAGLQWVLALRQVLARLDYSMLTTRYSARGRQAFHPRTVLGLLLYGLFVRQLQLRELERLSTVDLGAMWICGGHRLDHSTIGKFVQLHAVGITEELFEAVVRWVVRELALKPGLSSIDGTVVEAAASRWRALRAEAAQEHAAAAQAMAAAAPDDAHARARAERASAVAAVAAARQDTRAAQGKPTESVQVVPTEPEAVIQPRKDGVVRPAYKPSTLMHEAGVILGQHVHPSSETAAVPVLLAQHHKIFAAPPSTLLLDGGYCHGPTLGPLAEAGIDVLCPSGQAMGDTDWEKKGVRGRLAKSAFTYDESRDAYWCPGEQWLTYADRGRDAHGREYRRYRTAACAQCARRAQCTTSARGRRITRYAGDEYKEAMALVLQQPRAQAVYAQRMPVAETVHAELRERLGLRRFRRRGLLAVRAEFALYCIAFNLKKVLPHVEALFLVVCCRAPRPNGRPFVLYAVRVTYRSTAD